MTVYFDKSRGKWRYDFWRNRVRYTDYCRDQTGAYVTSRRAAEEAEKVEQRKRAIAPRLPTAQGMTLARALADLTPMWELQAHWSNKKRYIRELLAFFGPEKHMAEFDAGEVRRYVSFCITRSVVSWQGGPARDAEDPDNVHYWKDTGRKRGPNTANLYLGVLRQVLAHAGEVRDPISREPALSPVPVVPELDVPRRKARPVPDDVLSALMHTLPPHVVEAVSLTLFFGFRRAEVFELQISNVDFEAGGIRLFAEDVKDNEDTFLPGGPEAMAYVRRLADQARDRGTNHLITWRPYRRDEAQQSALRWQPISRPKGAWTRAMREIEAKFGRRWRWHDIRAAFITHVARTSGQLAAQALARHSDYSTTRTYVEVADEFRREAANRAAQRPALTLIPGGKSPTQKSHTGEKPRRIKAAKALK